MTNSFSKSTAEEQHAHDLEDSLLVRRFIEGDQTAFDQIMGKYGDTITNLANRLLGWPGNVDDVTQEVFLAAFMGLKKFRSDASLKTWLFTITINKTKFFRSKRFLRKQQQLSAEAVIENDCHLNTAETNLAEKEKFRQIRSVIASLSDKYRQPIVLRYLYEFDIPEISKIMGVSTNVINTRLNRAKQQLKNPLLKLYENE